MQNLSLVHVYDDTLEDEVIVTVIATGLDESNAANKIEQPASAKETAKEEAVRPATKAPNRAVPSSFTQVYTPVSDDTDSDLAIPTFLRKR